MTLPNKTNLTLISWLASRTPDQLRTVAATRALRPEDCRSFRTIADALLDKANLDTALSSLPRSALLGLAQLSPTSPLLSEMALMDVDSKKPLLLCEPESLAPLAHLTASDKAPALRAAAPLSAKEARAQATTALSLVIELGDLLDAMEYSSVTVNQDGSLTATGSKTLETILGAGYDIPLLWQLGTKLGLIGIRGNSAASTTRAATWRDLDDRARWSHLALWWWALAPRWLVDVLSTAPMLSWGDSLERALRFQYPLLEHSQTLESLVREAEALGLVLGVQPSPFGEAIFQGTDPSSVVSELWPESVGGVYSNEDFTLLATGPLSPQHRTVLNSLAVRELGGLVPRYRVQKASLLAAIQQGIPADSLQSLMESVSLNPLPAGVVALIEDVGRRAHDLEIRAEGHNTLITAGSEMVAKELLSDPGLVVLGLRAVGDKQLRCSWPAERVHFTLLGASYPALLVDESGAPVRPAESRAEEVDDNQDAALDAALDALSASAAEAAAKGVPAGIASIIEVATESKTPLEIVVTMPDGSPAVVVMEPRSLSAGRLRGVEVKHQVEKTLPVSHITSIRAAVPA
ncbi:MAG: hypothetical protein RL187_635 [Actinomycetota bacterium]